jgi:transcriptional regulator GlxA family with amidase domain
MAEIYRTWAILPLDERRPDRDDRPVQIAILLYEKLAALDAIGPYEVLHWVPGWEVRFVGTEEGEVRAEGGLGLRVDRTLDQVTDPDLVLVPGGEGCEAVAEDETVLSWLRGVDERTKWTTSVCTGSIVLGAAGLLRGRRATSNWLFLERLREYGADPVGGRFVEDGKTVTAAGVTAGIDMALHLVGREAGPEVAQAIQLGIEYDPDPPFDAGSPEKAPDEIVELVRSVSRTSVG